MAVIFADPGGEQWFSLSTSSILTVSQFWQTLSGSLTSSAATGRSTQYAYSQGGGSTEMTWQSVPYAATLTQIIVGFAYYAASNNFSNNNPVLTFQNGGTAQCELRTDGSGMFYFTRNGTNLGAGNPSKSSVGISSGWHYYECKIVLSTTTSGSAEIRKDSVSLLSLSSIQTATTTNNMSQVLFGTGIPNVQQYYKDMYFIDPSTGANTTFLGDVSVNVKWPTGVGVNQQYTNNGGASQTASVQDGTTHTGTWPDGDTSYISDSTVGHISDFAFQSTSSDSIKSVLHLGYIRKDDAGSRQASQVCLSGGTTEVGATINLGNTYLYYVDVLDQDPNTSAQWTSANLNAATFGIKTIS